MKKQSNDVPVVVIKRGPKPKPFELQVIGITATGTNGDVEVCGGVDAVRKLWRDTLTSHASNIRESRPKSA